MSDQQTEANERLAGVHAKLQARADALARTTGLDASRLLHILELTFIGFDGTFFLENLEILLDATDDQTRLPAESLEISATLQHEPLFAPDLEEALAVLSPKTALDTFESANLADLADRVAWYAYLTDDTTPVYTIEQLAELLRAFADHLERNRNELVITGYPRTNFARSIWLDWHLGRTYFVKLPLDIQVVGQEHGDLVCSYTWPDQPLQRFAVDELPAGIRVLGLDSGHLRAEDGSTYTLDGSPLRACPYEDAALILGMDPEDAKWLDTVRTTVVDLKIRVLRELAQCVLARDSQHLWPACLDLMTAALGSESAERCLHLDQFFSGFNVRSGTGTKLHDYLNAGGLTDLLMVVGHCAKELAIGTMHQGKQLIDRLPCVGSYYEAVGQPWRAKLDDMLDGVRSLQAAEAAFWPSFRAQVNDALENEFFEEVTIRIPVRRKLASKFELNIRMFAEWQKAQFELAGSVPTLQISVATSDSGARKEQPKGNMFRRQGSQWTIRFHEEEIALRHTRGMAYLAQLLSQPGHQLHVLALVHEDTDPGLPGGQARAALYSYGSRQTDQALRMSAWTDAGPLLDPQAKAEYKRRLDELKEELEEARLHEDWQQADRLEDEKAYLLQELKAAVGLGGRDRRAADPAERARVNVQKLIRAAIQQIASVSPALGQHLRDSIRTGYYCCYAPVEQVCWAS